MYIYFYSMESLKKMGISIFIFLKWKIQLTEKSYSFFMSFYLILIGLLRDLQDKIYLNTNLIIENILFSC